MSWLLASEDRLAAETVIPTGDHTLVARRGEELGDRYETVGPRKIPRTRAIVAARMPPSRHTATAFAVLR